MREAAMHELIGHELIKVETGRAKEMQTSKIGNMDAVHLEHEISSKNQEIDDEQIPRYNRYIL